MRVTPKSTLKSTSSPKKSVSCVSAVLFLLCQSRYVLFLLGLPQFFYSCYAIDIAGGVPTF
ncbi:Secreted protein [Pseudomonas sp. IT-P74]